MEPYVFLSKGKIYLKTSFFFAHLILLLKVQRGKFPNECLILFRSQSHIRIDQSRTTDVLSPIEFPIIRVTKGPHDLQLTKRRWRRRC